MNVVLLPGIAGTGIQYTFSVAPFAAKRLIRCLANRKLPGVQVGETILATYQGMAEMTDPDYQFADANALAWQDDDAVPGLASKPLGAVNGQHMELFRYAPNAPHPSHVHKGPEFVYILEGRARLAGQWLETGCSSIGVTGSVDPDFLAGEEGCVLLAVYTP